MIDQSAAKIEAPMSRPGRASYTESRAAHSSSPSAGACQERLTLYVLPSAMEACSFILTQGCLTPPTRRQMNFIAISPRCDTRAWARTRRTNTKPSVFCVSDHIFNSTGGVLIFLLSHKIVTLRRTTRA